MRFTAITTAVAVIILAPDMPLCTGFTIGGVSFAMDAPIPLKATGRLTSFLTEGEAADWYCRLEPVATLPLLKAEVCKQRYLGYKAYPAQPGCSVRGFFDIGAAESEYAVAFCSAAEGTVRVACLQDNYERYIPTVGSYLNHICLEWLLMQKDRFFLHAACVATPFGGVLFSGPSGAGKSTQADLWCQYAGATLINGDRALLHRSEAGWVAWGSPCAGSSDCYRNEQAPICAIVLPVKSRQLSLERVGAKEAFLRIYEQLTLNLWDREFVTAATEAAMQLVREVPVYRLACRPDKEAVLLLQNELIKGGC